MAEHEFESPKVEEFYNAFHSKADGRFTFAKGGVRGKIHVPMSDAARRSNAILRGLTSARKSKEYKTAKQNIHGTWANREKGQGGLRSVKGHNSKKSDAARALNAVKGAKTVRFTKNVASARSAMKFKNDTAGPSAALQATLRYGTRAK